MDEYGNPIEFVLEKHGSLLSRRHVFRMAPEQAARLAADLIGVVLLSGVDLEPNHPLRKRFKAMRGDSPREAAD